MPPALFTPPQVKKGSNVGLWIVDAKNGNGSVEFEGKTKPDVTLTMEDSDLVNLMTGQLNPQKAFFQVRAMNRKWEGCNPMPIELISPKWCSEGKTRVGALEVS